MGTIELVQWRWVQLGPLGSGRILLDHQLIWELGGGFRELEQLGQRLNGPLLCYLLTLLCFLSGEVYLPGAVVNRGGHNCRFVVAWQLPTNMTCDKCDICYENKELFGPKINWVKIKVLYKLMLT